MPAIKKIGVVAFGSDLCPADIFQLHDAVLRVLDNDVLELFWIGKPSNYAQSHLKALFGIGGWTSKLTGRDLYILLLQRRNDIGCRQLPSGQAGGIEPDAHSILALAKNQDIADTGDTFQRVL